MTSHRSYSSVRVSTIGDTDSLPLQIEVRGSRRAIWVQAIAAGVLVLFGLFFDFSQLTFLFGEKKALAEQVLRLTFFLVAALFALRALSSAVTRSSIRIGRNTVDFRHRSILSRQHWSEPLSGYHGLQWARFTINEGRHRTHSTRNRFRHVLELSHPNEARSLPLVVHETGRSLAELRGAAERSVEDPAVVKMRKRWETLAALLGVSAIDARDGVATVRDVEDLDKSVKQMAEEGKLDVDWNDSPPPASLEAESIGDPANPDSQELRVVIRGAQNPILIYLMGGVGALMLLIGLFTLQFGLILGGALFAGAGYFIWHQGENNPRRLTVTREELQYTDPSVESRSFNLKLATIEGIELRDQDSQSDSQKTLKLQGKELLISADQGEYAAAAGLSDEALEWLKGYLVAAIARA